MMQAAAERRFREMYEANQRLVLAYFLRRTDSASAFDGAAETFLVAWRRIDEVPQGVAGLRWLYGVARRVLANQRRSRQRQTALADRLSHQDSLGVPSPETVVVRRAEDEEMLEAVGRLRAEDRELLRLAVWEELPNAEIAALLGTSPHAISQRLHRITRRIARDLQRPRLHPSGTRPMKRGGGAS